MAITQAELDAIRARAEAATVGPWTINKRDYPENKNAELITNKHLYITKVFTKSADAEFIAAARQDVPKLLAEVDRLRSLSQQILSEYDDVERHYLSNFASRYEREIEIHEKYIANYIREIDGGASE